MSGELPKDQPEDTDQEFEVIFDGTQEPRQSEEKRPILDPSTADLLDMLQRFLAASKRELTRHSEALRRDPDNKLHHQALIDRELKSIKSLEDGIKKLLGGHR